MIKVAIDVLKSQKIEKGRIITFQDVFDGVVEELIKNFGFKKVEFAAKFNAFGWANILDEKDWEDDRGEQLNLLTKAVTAKLLE